MFAEVANFANDAAAVEKSLRLLQALVQIAAGTTSSTADAKTWNMARGHFALARRYLRLFKWIDFSQATHQSCTSPDPDSSRRTLKTAKNALLALYFFMEMFCITNAMTITHSSLLVSLQHHALQIWFFAISVSFLLTCYDLLFFSTSSSATRKQLYTNLIVDCCDILIPGSAVNWIPVSLVTVGVASSISSVMVGKQIWERVQKEAQQKEQRNREKANRKVRFEDGTKEEREEKEEIKTNDAKKGSNGVVNGSVKALVNAVGNGNGSVKKRSKQT